jgi:hypothetical protein
VIEDEIRALELSLLTSPERLSAEFLDRVISDEFREFGASGHTYDKHEAIAMLLKAPSPPSADPTTPPELVDFRAVELAPGVALATWRTPRSLRSSIWRREGGTWRICFHQGTVTPPHEKTA